AGRIGQHQVEILAVGPAGAGGRGLDRGTAGLDETALGIAQLRVGHLVGQGIGQLDVADGAADLPDVGSHALVALAADAGRPAHRGAFADLLLPLRRNLGQVIDEVEGGAGTVRAVHDGDAQVGQGQAGVEGGDGRVVPLADPAQVDVGQDLSVQAQLVGC